GVIAVTVIWGYFSGPPSIREIVEFDVLFDTDFTWGNATVNPTLMDLQNIATHEIGHGAGLGDLY
ncbi:MAG: peptidase M10A and M12B matrixin and adamalysin, partial [Candidatus Dadabacteria bacterium]|nr:peptidase M10A and M12B matrixin and adamalysin [Candidatus Dadabacteria bacterium]NIQ13643.1 peptidase M10A and M12B matrixin and adamalysin [Candidatus Dadabacteria bacterium]